MKNYVIRFGTNDSRTYTGLTPTFLFFVRATDGVTIAPPGISEIISGSGLYTFAWGTTQAIAFLADGFTTSLGTGRYVSGGLDPADRADEYGNTMIAIGNTLIFNAPANMGATLVAIGNTAIALGTTSVAWGLANNTLGTNIGTTLVAVGNTAIALGTTGVAYGLANFGLGTTGVALGTTNVALGTTNIALDTNIGTTLVAIGNTAIALGTTGVALGTTSVALGTTAVAIGTSIYANSTGSSSPLASLIGSTASSFGTNLADPTDLFGYLKRVMENLEGNSNFTKQSGSWAIFSRSSSQLLITKTITNGTSQVTKT